MKNIDKNYKCNICFDTIESNEDDIINLTCKHSFHIKCLNTHMSTNGNICSLCRNQVDSNDLNIITFIIIKDANFCENFDR